MNDTTDENNATDENDTTDELDCTDEEALTREVADEQLEAADPTKPILWTYPTTSCGGAACPGY
jgi:hypothetical protein